MLIDGYSKPRQSFNLAEARHYESILHAGKLTDHQKKTLRTSCTYMAIRIPSPSDLARVAMAIRAWPLLYAARARNKLNPIDRA
jgi:hypothetical protein